MSTDPGQHAQEAPPNARQAYPAAPGPSTLAAKWKTVSTSLRVLAVIHNVTSATRMSDVLTALECDPRVQTVVTWTKSSPFTHGVEEFLRDSGRLFLEWEKALEMRFDLAITTSLGGELHQIKAPLLRIPHGMGYNKHLKPEAGSRKPEAGSRKPEAGSRKPEAGSPVFGLSREWLLHEGRVVPTALVLSHEEQYIRLAKSCPEALTAAFVAGDPCYDRLTASLPHRSRYRRALGLRPGQRLVLISSTWGTASLFGRYPHLARALLASLPVDEYKVALALHPNVWHGHGPGQVEAWLADAGRAGLLVLPPNQGWQAAVVAADAVFGDHGSVPYYAAALGRPVVLDRTGRDLVDSASPIAELLDAAVPYEPGTRVEDTLALARRAQEHTTRVARASVSSHPGRSLALIRQAMYRLMDAEEPAGPPLVQAVPDPVPRPVPPSPALWVTVSGGPADGYRLWRVPAAALTRPAVQDDGESGFLMVWERETDSRLSELADIVVCPSDDLPEDGDEWCRNVFRHRAGPRAAAYYDADGCVLRTRSGRDFACTVEKAENGFDPGLLVAVLHHRLVRTAGETAPLPRHVPLRIRSGSDATVTVTITHPRRTP